MRRPRLRLAYAGTPMLASTLLDTLLHSQHDELGLVLTQPDRPTGRGRKMNASLVKQHAEKWDIPVLQPASAKELDIQRLAQFDLLIVVAYGLLLPYPALSAPLHGTINIHFSLLPRWRGATPIQHAILSGDKETGISIMQIDEGLDTGPVYWTAPCPIEQDDTTGSLQKRLGCIARQALPQFLDAFARNTLTATIQAEAQASYAPKLSRQDAKIDWQCSNEVIERRIRAFNPAPIAYSTINGKLFRIWQARRVDEQHTGKPGDIIRCDRRGLLVMTGKGAINILMIQTEGKKAMSIADFINGRPDFFTRHTQFDQRAQS